MKLSLFLIPALMAAPLFAQDVGSYSARRSFNAGAQGAPGEFHAQSRFRGMRMGRLGFRGGEMRGFMVSRMLQDPAIRQQAGVSADQAAKILQQQSDFEKAEIHNRADLQVKRIELNQLMAAQKPDRGAIDKKIAEIGAVQSAIEKSAIDNRLNMRDALTPLQRQKLEQIIAQRESHFGGAHAYGPGEYRNFSPNGVAPNAPPAPTARP